MRRGEETPKASGELSGEKIVFQSSKYSRQILVALSVASIFDAGCTNSGTLGINSITTGGTLNSTTTSDSATKLKISSVTVGAASSGTTSSTTST